MKNDLEAAIASIGLFILAVFVLWAGSLLIPMDRETHQFLTIAVSVLSVIDALLLIYLFFIYIKSYLEIKSRFSLGLIIFLFSLILFILTSNRFIMALISPPPLKFLIMSGPPSVIDIIPLVFSTISLAILAYLSNE